MLKSGLKAMLMAIVATAILIIFLVLALLLAPQDAIPEFEITDQQGTWRSQGKIAVFDNMIHPGSDGSYEFVIRNESTERLIYGIRLAEFLNNVNQSAQPFMQYRIKFDNKYIDGDEWRYIGFEYNDITILPGSEHLMTLEWRWPFESGKDVNDTLIGVTGGRLGVSLFIWSEVVYD